MMSDDHAPTSPCESNETDDTTYFMPWLKVILLYYSYTNYFYNINTHKNILLLGYNFRL